MKTCTGCKQSCEDEEFYARPQPNGSVYRAQPCKGCIKARRPKRILAKDQACQEAGCDRLIGLHGAHGRCPRCAHRLAVAAVKLSQSPCTVAGCTRYITNYGTDLCDMHRNRVRRHGSVGDPAPVIAQRGEGYIKDGYRIISVNGRQIPEHRIVMAGMLGRPLRDFENPHHLNGIRSDNSPSNLELWTKPQPAGQRPEDLVAWVLDNYSDLVEAESRRRRREARTGQLRLVDSL